MAPAGIRAHRIALVTLLLAGAASVMASQTSLEVVSCESGDLLVRHALVEEDRWCIAWNHSVTGAPVRDCYIYHGGRMVLERSHQPDFAAGLGHTPGRGRQESDGEGGYWIEDILEPVPGDAYLLRVGSAAVDHRLVLADGAYGLSERIPSQQVVIRLGGSEQTALANCP
ncbi:MAG: DUF1850 domain-containing protein [Ectothiorhodospiraceae bacterium]|nr:DUF1850 domain-containing protein [Ectothiorhodospiraceae bacterium]